MSTPETTWGAPLPPSHPSEITKNKTEWFEVGAVGLAASGDRLVIEEDQFRSGYECKTCGGSGKVSSTLVRGATKTCPDCDGKGGTLIVPDANQRRPTTGTVRSAGELCKVFNVGDGVLFSNFAGLAIDFNHNGRTVCLRIIHETEALAKVRGHLELRSLSNQREATSI